jgi:hypothetical protein
MNSILERLAIHMPQFYPPPENWNDRGRSKITFKPFWRNIPLVRNYPLWVGDRVEFDIHIDKMGNKNPYALQVVHEMIDNVVIQEHNIEGMDTNIKSMPIASEGNLKFSFGTANYALPNNPLIVTANVQNKDRWWLGCVGLIAGAVVTFIVTIASGIVLGIIEIDKFWHIINPFWR